MSTPTPTATPTASDAGTRSVLVVIADPQEQARAVSALGLRPDLVVTAVDSIEAAHDLVGDADVMVVDGDLRPKGGYSWLYELGEDARLAGTSRPPALVLTERPDDRFMVAWSGAEGWMAKPVDPFRLVRDVDALASA